MHAQKQGLDNTKPRLPRDPDSMPARKSQVSPLSVLSSLLQPPPCCSGPIPAMPGSIRTTWSTSRPRCSGTLLSMALYGRLTDVQFGRAVNLLLIVSGFTFAL